MAVFKFEPWGYKMRKIFLLCLFMFVNVVYATDVELAWYDGDTTINGPTSCTVGGTFLPPTPPARTGYVFNGWKIKPRTCGIDQFDASIRATDRGYTMLNGSAGDKESQFGLTRGSGQWAAKFSYGTIWGMANCNSVNGGSRGIVSTPTLASSGIYCWCQATGFTASGNDYTSGPQCTVYPTPSSWVFYYKFASGNCAQFCPDYCSRGLVGFDAADTTYRNKFFGAVGQ